MQPFSRETITDRRQPYVRWTAILAGALSALGTWLLLQLLFTGGALSAIAPDEVERVHAYGIGTSIGSVLAPLIAMFVGGLVAGRLAAYYDRRISGFHGALVWTIASVLGLAFLGSAVSSLVNHDTLASHADMAVPAPGTSEFVDDTVADLDAMQKAQHAPAVDKDDLIEAARYASTGRNTFDRNAFVERLDKQTSLSRPEADAVLANLGDRAGDFFVAANQLAIHREHALAAAKDAGKGMFAAGIGLLLCLISAIGGSVIGSNIAHRRGGHGGGKRNSDDRAPDVSTSSSPAMSSSASVGSGTHHRSFMDRMRDAFSRNRFHRDPYDVHADNDSDDIERLADRTFDRRHDSRDLSYGVRDVRRDVAGDHNYSARDTDVSGSGGHPPDRRSAVFTTARYPVVK